MGKKYLINERGFHPLVYYYDEARDYFLDEKGDSAELFVGSGAQKYINKQFKTERMCTAIKICLDKITEFRAQHTVSAFFLGLTLKKNLQLNTKDWKRLPGESKSGKGSFRLFWSWICLFHDIGYSYEEPRTEEKRKEYEKLATIDDFIKHQGISYSLLDHSANRDLISNYYAYRKSQGKLDHGIVGALLLFNALMILAKDDKYNKVYSEIKNNQQFYSRICDAIARHNMWRATPDTKKIYEEYGLSSLIPSSNMEHKILYRDNTLEFLLALVDTIDPLKAFYKDNRSSEPISINRILNEVRFKFNNKQKTLIEAFDDPLFRSKIKQYTDPVNGLESWLGVRITVPENAEYMKIEIDKKGMDLSMEDLSRTDFRQSSLSEADFGGSDFIESNLSEADLQAANLRETNLQGTNFDGANLIRANLIRANLIRANLIRANLSGANLSGADFRGADLSRANLSRANLIGADLSKADLSGANLIGADLSKADFNEADLSEANLRGANLIGADLRGANLSGANITGADLTEADITGVDFSRVIDGKGISE